MRKPFRRALALAAALALLAAVAPPPRVARAQEPSDERIIKTAQAALAPLVAYPQHINQVRVAIDGIFLGPGSVNVSCKTSLGVTVHYPYGPLDFSGLRGPLKSILSSSERQSNEFTSNLNGRMQKWLKESVPAMSRNFTCTSAWLQDIQRNVSRGVVTVDAGRMEAAAALGELAEALQGGADELKQIMEQLARYLQQQKADQRQLADVRERADGVIQNVFNLMNTKIKNEPCGQDDALNQFNAFKGRIDGSFSTLDTALFNLKAQTAVSDQAGSALLGKLVTFVTKYNFVAGQVKQAQTAEAVNQAIANLRLNVAAAAWKDFSASAQQLALP